MQPAQIRRIAVSRQPGLKLSFNNCRDVVRFLRSSKLVTVAGENAFKNPLYELSEEGRVMQRLLIQAEQPAA